MLRIALFAALIAVLALLVWRVRTGKLELRASNWPLGQQLEIGLSALLAVAAGLGALAGEYRFAGWLLLVSATVLGLALVSWTKRE